MTSLLVILALVAVAAAVYYYNDNKTNKSVAPVSEPKTPKAKTPKAKTGGGSEDNSLEISVHESIEKS